MRQEGSGRHLRHFGPRQQLAIGAHHLAARRRGRWCADRLKELGVDRLGHDAVQAQFDLYNAFNSGAITALNTRYGPQWLRPTSILAGRVLKFGTQIEF